MTEPRTKAGKALLAEIEYDLEDQGGARASIENAKAGFRDRIRAIEVEAAAQLDAERLARIEDALNAAKDTAEDVVLGRQMQRALDDLAALATPSTPG